MSNTQDVRHILVIEDQKSKRIVSLNENTYTIGRDPNSSVILYDRQVSRHHATLLRITDYQHQHCTYRLIDGNLQGKKSTNGLIVNGKYTLSHELKHGDLIRFGSSSKASYHIISTSSEIDLLKAGDSAEDIPESPLGSFSGFEDNYEQDQEQNQEIKRTVIFHKPKDVTIPDLGTGVSSLAEFSPNPIVEINFTGDITYVNPAASIKFPDLKKLKFDHPILNGLLNNSLYQAGTSFVREVRSDENYFEQHVHYIPDQKVVRSYIFDITKYKKVEAQLESSKERYNFLIERTSEGIFLVDPNSTKILEANLGICELLGYQYEEIVGTNIYQIIAIDREIVETELGQVLDSGASLTDESLYRCKDGSLISVESRVIYTRYMGKEIFCFSVRDISDRKRSEEKMQYQIFHDTLTNLPNRTFFNKQLSIAMANAQKNQTLLAVMFLDLDSFKNINNSLGHSFGDKVLQSFAQRLTSCVRGGDVIARWGNDEFTVLLPRIKNIEDTVKLAQRIFDDLKQPFTLDNEQLQIKVSIGIAIYPQDGDNEEILLKNADAALVRTKEKGRNHYQFYTPILSSEASLLLKLESSIHKALDRREFYLHYQPQINIKTGQVTGMEALLRWEVPEIGLILPNKFISLAEKTDLILQINKWILKTACEQNMAWQEAGLSPVPVAINLSSREFRQTNLVEVVARVLEKTGLDPQWLELEVTENILRENLKNARQIFQDFNNLGVRMTLDDFGLGFSSLGFFKQYSFRSLKIHQLFMRDIKGSSQDLATLSAIITLGRGFNLRVIAEGVETQQQLDLLKNLQCEEAQGYLFSRPLRASEATQFLTDHSPLTGTTNQI